MSAPAGGGRPTFDPRSQAHLAEVRKRGEWYTVEGYVRGQRVHVDIPAEQIDSRCRGEAEALMRRSLLGTANQEDDRDSTQRA